MEVEADSEKEAGEKALELDRTTQLRWEDEGDCGESFPVVLEEVTPYL